MTWIHSSLGSGTSFKVIGKDLKVDLLVPSRKNSKPFATVPVAELGAHATSLPFLEYLIEAPGEALIVGRDHLIPVLVPQPIRYALHKLVVADLRYGADKPKIEKNLVQAGVLASILAHEDPHELLQSSHRLTPAMRKHARNSLPKWKQIMGDQHPAVVELVVAAVG